MSLRTLLPTLLFLVVLPFTVTAQETPADLSVELAAYPWLDIRDVMTEADEDGTATYTVFYISREFDMVAYRSEMLELLRVLGTLDIETDATVRVVSMAKMGDGKLFGVEIASAPAQLLTDYAVGDVTRTALLSEISITVMEHGAEDPNESPA
ncbi:MAG: hypothetical protein AAF125_11065 [Chloroflexota bacterium]